MSNGAKIGNDDVRSSSHKFHGEEFIDNTQKYYTTVQLQCGINLQCCPNALTSCPKITKILEQDVRDCLTILPPSVHSLLRRTVIWVNESYTYGLVHTPKAITHSAAHHHSAWLLSVKDLPQKTLGIEIYSSSHYLTNRLYWNGCGLLLHEYCHLIHQLVLYKGLNNVTILRMFRHAVKSGRYDSVLRRDWTGLPCDTDTAYATINHKEFFAEMSVTYLSIGYPQLDAAAATNNMEDFTKMEQWSPPFLIATNVLDCRETNTTSKNASIPIIHNALQSTRTAIVVANNNIPWWRRLHQKLLQPAHGGHCNKFFPFTRGQLMAYDPEVATCFTELWLEISNWDDPLNEKNKCWVNSWRDNGKSDCCCWTLFPSLETQRRQGCGTFLETSRSNFSRNTAAMPSIEGDTVYL